MSRGPARRLASALDRHGLAVPARLLVDAHRPLAPLLSDVSAALGPLARVGVGRLADDPRAVLDEPDGLGRLAAELEVLTDGGERAEPG